MVPSVSRQARHRQSKRTAKNGGSLPIDKGGTMRRTTIALLVAAAVIIGACSSSDDDSAENDSADETTTSSESSPYGTDSDTSTSQASGPGGDVTVEATNDGSSSFAFDPDVIELTAATEASVEVTNTGSVPHTFTVEELDVDSGTLDPGASTTVSIETPDEAGDLEFICRFHQDRGMVGTIAVG
ncbi:MAG: cupredoxin domain-containing protein [Actinobacteria bacterium]|nr:MAG: cupredoxin domain-containing protein [Actinomycetota bacterium]RIK03581.1 MAG: hypothetical protein DCC48_16185 [Acidobacteriota bacterium]